MEVKSGRDAERLGLADSVAAEGGDIHEVCMALLEPVLNTRSTIAVGAIKKAIAGVELSRSATAAWTPAEGSSEGRWEDEERRQFRRSWGGPDNLAAVERAVSRMRGR